MVMGYEVQLSLINLIEKCLIFRSHLSESDINILSLSLSVYLKLICLSAHVTLL